MEALTVLLVPSQAPALNAASDAATGMVGAEARRLPQDLFAALLAEQLGTEGAEKAAVEVLVDTAMPEQADEAAAQSVIDPAALAGQLGLPVSPAAVALPLQTAATGQQVESGVQLTPLDLSASQTASPLLQPETSRPAAVGQNVVSEQAETAAPLFDVPAAGTRMQPASEVVQRQVAATQAADFAGGASGVPEGAAATLSSHGAELHGETAALASSSSSVMSSTPTMPFTAMPQPTAANAALPQQVIPQPVTSPAWGSMLGDRVIWMVGQQQQSAEIHLNPPALGPLEIRLNVQDGQASLTFTTQHVPVREVLEAATPRLREMLGESGISLGSVSVNVGTFSQQAAGDQSASGERRGPYALQMPEEALSHFETRLPAPTGSSALRGLVDLFA